MVCKGRNCHSNKHRVTGLKSCAKRSTNKVVISIFSADWRTGQQWVQRPLPKLTEESRSDLISSLTPPTFLSWVCNDLLTAFILTPTIQLFYDNSRANRALLYVSPNIIKNKPYRLLKIYCIIQFLFGRYRHSSGRTYDLRLVFNFTSSTMKFTKVSLLIAY